jgi:hypothetical protein
VDASGTLETKAKLFPVTVPAFASGVMEAPLGIETAVDPAAVTSAGNDFGVVIPKMPHAVDANAVGAFPTTK